MSWNPNDDWTPPKTDNGEPELSIEKWKFDALLRGAFNRSMQNIVETMHGDGMPTRNDDAAGASALSEEQKPPELAADAEPVKPTIDPEVMKMIEDRIDELTARMDALERRRAAEAALTALEDEIEQMYPPKQGDDLDLLN
jgi:hypothetical protein